MSCAFTATKTKINAIIRVIFFIIFFVKILCKVKGALKYIKNSPRPEFQKEKCDFSKDELIDKFELLYKLTNENLNTQFCYQELDNSLYQISLN